MGLTKPNLASRSRAAIMGALLAGTAVTIISSAAQADMPEYWTRETFHTERSTVASLFKSSERDSDEDGETRSRPEPRKRQAYRSPERSRLGGPQADEEDDTPRQRRREAASRNVRVASIGRIELPERKERKSLSGGGGINWIASSGCLNGTVRGVLADVASRFGSVTVNSTCRSKSHNASVGGASKSWHLTGDAADFRVHGNWGAAAAYLRGGGRIGGFKHYGGGLFHIDTGPTRSW